MNRVLRAFLVWLMVIAMPVQGLAASAMIFCGPHHERLAQGLVFDAPAAGSEQAREPLPAHAAAVHAAHGHAAHGDAAHGHAAHGHATMSDAGAAPGSADADHDADSADSAEGLLTLHGKFSCSACAACCSALALPASFSLPEAVSPAQVLRTSPSAPVASHRPDGLDRPPRALLA